MQHAPIGAFYNGSMLHLEITCQGPRIYLWLSANYALLQYESNEAFQHIDGSVQNNALLQ